MTDSLIEKIVEELHASAYRFRYDAGAMHDDCIVARAVEAVANTIEFALKRKR